MAVNCAADHREKIGAIKIPCRALRAGRRRSRGCCRHTLHAQSQPPGFAVVELDVQQPEEFASEFVPLLTKAVTDQHGKVLAPPGPTTTIEGNPPKRAAVIMFESVDPAVATFGSAAYRNALKIGDRYARFQIFAAQDAER
jgi:uncharacterized protein (DUF1330 family)